MKIKTEMNLFNFFLREIIMETAIIISIIGAVTAVVVFLAKLIYSSKCKEVDCCFGCCHISRAVDQEASVRHIGSSHLEN